MRRRRRRNARHAVDRQRATRGDVVEGATAGPPAAVLTGNADGPPGETVNGRVEGAAGLPKGAPKPPPQTAGRPSQNTNVDRETQTANALEKKLLRSV